MLPTIVQPPFMMPTAVAESEKDQVEDASLHEELWNSQTLSQCPSTA